MNIGEHGSVQIEGTDMKQTDLAIFYQLGKSVMGMFSLEACDLATQYQLIWWVP